MTRKQPFLPGFPTTLCGRIRRHLQDVIASRRKALQGSSIASYALQFSHILPVDFLEAHSGSQRRRHYCNVNVFWAWLAQILEANPSCSKGVSLVQAWCADANLPAPPADTGAYCKVRNRIRAAFLRVLRGRVNAWLAARIRPEDKYEGLVVKSIDGSSVQLEDTAENQADYPQPASQKPGCGFPVMGIMGVPDHRHGGWEDFATCAEPAHDAPVAHKLPHNFGEGDLACADRAFRTYELIALMRRNGAHALMRLHQSRHRTLDFRRGKKRRMVLATTLLDASRYEGEELAAISARRWDIELRLRDVKTTLGMERFKVRTPEMARKKRPKSFGFLTRPRAEFKEIPHRGKPRSFA